MTSIGIRELKSKLSEHLRLVRAGNRIQISDRGTPVAEIVPPGWSVDPGIEPRLAQLAREGKIRLPTRPRSKHLPKYPRLVPPGTVQRWLDEDRNDERISRI